MPTRSATLAVSTVLAGAGATDLVQVPAGETWIIKSVEVALTGFVTSTVQVGVRTDDNSVSVRPVQQSVASPFVAHYTGWIVLEPTDWIWASTSAQDANLWISGTRLVGVAP